MLFFGADGSITVDSKPEILSRLQAELREERASQLQRAEEALSQEIRDAHNLAETDLEEYSALLESDYPVPPDHGLRVHSVPFSYLQKITLNFAKNGNRERFIGVGGFAEVYLGKNPGRTKTYFLTKNVIVKVFNFCCFDSVSLYE